MSALNVSGSPDPFQSGSSVLFTVAGGTPPYTCDLAPSPPNPPGLTIIRMSSTSWQVAGTQGLVPGTKVYVLAQDAADHGADGDATVA